MKFCSLYSGSSGNSLYLESDHAKILIDTGVSAKKVVNGLSSINVSIQDIDAIVVSHEHSDHVQGLGTLSNKYHLPVYANKKTWDAMPTQKDKIEDTNIRFYEENHCFAIEDIDIFAFSIPHDAASPCGFNFICNNNKLSIATDLGHITSSIIEHLDGSNFLMLESNYDTEVLKCCSYPYSLKTRISGPTGHLSNSLAGKTIAHLAGHGLEQVMLGHLSKESNFPALAYQTVMDELQFHGCDMSHLSLQVADRNTPSKLISIHDSHLMENCS